MATGFVVDVYREGLFVASHAVSKDWVKIGRLHSSDVVLEDDAVARMHAVVERDPGGLRIVDLGSALGTWVDGARVHKHRAIPDGSRIRIGAHELMLRDRFTPVQNAQASRARFVPSEDLEVCDGSVSAEVMVGLGDTVLEVRHLGRARPHRKRSWALSVLGGALLLGGMGSFAFDVAADWDAHREAVSAAQTAGRPHPPNPGTPWGGWALGLAFVGLIPMSLGGMGLRERPSHRFVIGEGDEATFTVDGGELPLANATELVRVEDGNVVLQVPASMSMEVFSEGHRVEKADELAQVGGASSHPRELRLKLGDRARVQWGSLTFWVNAVRPGRAIATRTEADRAFWSYNAVSFSVLGSLFALGLFAAEDAQAFELDPSELDNRFVGYIHAPDVLQEPPLEEVSQEHDAPEAGTAGARHPGNEGAAGSTRAEPARKRLSVRRIENVPVGLSRNHDPDMIARRAGIVGLIEAESGHFLSSPFASFAYTSGENDEDLWGNLADRELGESGGIGGMGLIGSGRGGGGGAEGMVGWSSSGTIGRRGGGGGAGLEYGRRGGTGFEERPKRKPRVHVATAETPPGYDRSVIRRTVRSHINEVRHCYNQGLVRDPKLVGRVVVAFNIGSTGKVVSSVVSDSSLGDAAVANCIARAVRRWRFTRPQSAGTVLVRYPFVLSPG